MHFTLIALTFLSVLIGSNASAQTIIDLPAPPRKGADAQGASDAGTDGNDATADTADGPAADTYPSGEIDPGTMALLRYSRGRYYPRPNGSFYGYGYRRPYRSYSGYGYAWPWGFGWPFGRFGFGHFHHHHHHHRDKDKKGDDMGDMMMNMNSLGAGMGTE